MGYVQLLVAILGAARELFKWLASQKECNREIAKKVQAMSSKIKEVNAENPLSIEEIELAFADAIGGGGSKRL